MNHYSLIRWLKKTACLVFLLPVVFLVSQGQPGTWTWMKGNSFNDPPGVYGTQGIPDATNTPPANYAPATWTDLDGNFWIYGGAYQLNSYSDLWKFDPSTEEWTWVKGPAIFNEIPVYGTQGIPSPTNTPGARGFGVATWTSDAGELWLYGGTSFFASGFTDVWKYNIPTNEWTWMGTFGGPAAHGQIGIPSASNTPGDRSEMSATWKDSGGNFWFYGGQGGNGSFEDMWKYDPGINQWAWMHGDTTSGFNVQTFAAPLGQFDNANSPGKRNIYCHWKDDNDHFYIFGGGNPYFSIFSDLWEYDPVINQWAWIGGDATNFSQGNFTMKCDTAPADFPRGSSENRACWTDKAGNFWMFGGEINSTYDVLSDLWAYVPSKKDWVWMKGNNMLNFSGIYGTQGVPDPANIPKGRFGTGNWMDNNCNLWVFGGAVVGGSFGLGYLNDLWKYIPDTTCLAAAVCNTAPSPAIIASDQSVCQKFCVSFTDGSTNNPTAWQWIFDGGTPSSSTLQNPPQVCYQSAGTFDVTLITTSSAGNDTIVLTDYITVFPTPPFPTITQNGFTLTSSPAVSYQWQFNSTDIPGATNQSYDILQSGYYTVVITDVNGCTSSTTLYLVIEGIDAPVNMQLSIYPNPSAGSFMVSSPAVCPPFCESDDIKAEVYNTLGQVVFSSIEKIHDHQLSVLVNIGDAPAGIYFLSLTQPGNKSNSSQNVINKKLVVIK